MADNISEHLKGCDIKFIFFMNFLSSSMSSADIFAIGHYLAKGKAEAEAVPWLQEVTQDVRVIQLLAECHVKQS